MNTPLQRWLILMAVLLMVFAINVDYTAVNLALVSISHDIDTTINTLQWLLSGYALAWGASVVAAGRMADIYGRRRMLLWGVVIFGLSSATIGLAENATVAIIGRVIQGIGGAFFVPPLYSLTFATFEGDRQGFAMGLIGAAAGIGLAIGPTFGGFFLEYLNWRWIFFINVPLCVTTYLLISTLVKKEPKRIIDERLDRIGAVLLGVALASIIYGLSELTTGSSTPISYGILGTGIVALVSFIRWQQRCKHALIPGSLLKNTSYIWGTVAPFFAHQFTFSVVLVTIGFYLQNVLALDAYTSGLVFLSLTLGFGLLSIYGGTLTDSLGLRLPGYMGLFVIAIGTFLLSTLGENSPIIHVIVALAVTGVGLGLAFPSFNTAMMKVVKPSEVTIASGFFVMFCLIGHTTAIIISSSMISTAGAYYLKKTYSYPVEVMGQLCTILSCPHRDPSLFDGLPHGYDIVLNEAFMYALKTSMGLCALLSLVGAFFCYRYLLLKDKT